MLLEIKKVRRCRNGAYGNFLVRGRGRAVITISMAKNKHMHEYAATVLHEMLHAYTTILRADGFRVKDTTEHRWIYAVEAAVIRLMTKHLRRK